MYATLPLTNLCRKSERSKGYNPSHYSRTHESQILKLYFT